MKYTLIFISFLVIFCQCNSNSYESKYEENIPVTSIHQLQSETLNDSFLFSWPRDIIIIDSLLVVHDSYKQSNCFHIFNKNTGIHIQSFGKKGRGPGELLEINSVNYKHDGRSIIAFDPNMRKIIIFDIINTLTGIKPDFKELIVENSPNFIKQMLPYRDMYIAKGNSDKMRYGMWDPAQNLFFNLYTDYPALSKDEETNWALTDYSVKVRLSPNGQKLVTGTYIGGVLEVFNVDDGHIIPFSSRYFFKPRYTYARGAIPKWVTAVAETKIGFEDIFLDNEYIYGLIWGIEKSSMTEHRPYIVQFDYRGTPICRYEVNLTLESFAVDDDNTIYAIGYDDGKYSLNKYANIN